MIIFVKDIYFDGENTTEKLVPLEEYCAKGVKKANGGLYDLENLLSELLGRDINLKRDLPEVRNHLLDMSGQFGRLPENIVIIDE